MTNKNGIVLLAGRGHSTSIVYNALCKEFPIAQVIIEDRVPRARFLQRRIKRLGLRKVAGQLLFRTLVVPWLEVVSANRIEQIKRAAALDDVAPITGVSYVPSVNSDEAIRLLRDLSPVVVVVNGTRIIVNEVLNCIPATFINMHAGITPLYRGVHGAYWALVERNRSGCGVTIHYVDKGVDTGGILAQALVEPTAEDNFVTYPYLQLAAGIPLLKQVVRNACNGRLEQKPALAGPSKMWTHPTLGEYLRYRFQLGVK